MADGLERIENPYGEREEEQGALAQSNAQRETSEVQAAMVIAKKFPRDEQACMDRILNACARKGLAETAVYSYAKGGTSIEGPSIRLAECIAQHWQNLQFGIRELEQGNGVSTVEAFAWDVENNTRQTKVFQVEHKRHTQKGDYKLTDPREIYEMVANQGARRLRACILGIIPGDVTEAAVEQCSTTMKQNEEVTEDSIKKMLEAFARYGIEKRHIEKRIQRRMESITPALMVNLRKIYTSLKDGMSGPADWFDIQTQQSAEDAQQSREELRQKVTQQDGGRQDATNEAEPAQEPAQAEQAEAPKVAAIAQAMGVKQKDLRDYCDAQEFIGDNEKLSALSDDQRWTLYESAEYYAERIREFVNQTEGQGEDFTLNSE